ncbi:DNA cytosine methyltransferase [Nocardia xishanensis]|uniref:DNA cytosine methyltransferase n=1 Tax=Nocardia xishanensis TaxID=238964 RepID=UPI0008305F36|nr:DNA cytosine methyltransferase [Nocardia xishanensis]
MTLTVTDLFAGSGGSSTGLADVPGLELVLAMNHWQLAIDTHASNHPRADHKCADISQYDPRLAPRTDILWASPSCTHHSQASGKKRNHGAAAGDRQPDLFGEILPDEAAERSRATMWDVLRFTELHRYRAVIVENVVDVMQWVMFPAWRQAWGLLGYEIRFVFMNSMHAQAGGVPAPQSRDRWYAVAWPKGNRAPDLEKWTRPRAWCVTCDEWVYAVKSWKRPDREPWGRYRAQYVWRCPRVKCRNSVIEPGWLPAASAIDWTLPGERIGDRVKPLAEKTMARICAGLSKFYGSADGLLVPAGGSWNETAYPLTEAMRTRTTRESEGLLIPVEGRDGKVAGHVREPLRTQTARNETGLLVPYYGNGNAATTSEPDRTMTTHDRYAFVVPLRNNNTPKSVRDPLDTFAAAGNHHALATTAVPNIEDCMFRMLTPDEIKRGMAFPDDYTLLGNKREKVRLCGNAVTPPAARDLGAAVAESLGHVVGEPAAVAA